MTTPLWTPNPNTLSETHLYAFMQAAQKMTYDALYDWSINSPAEFWKLCANFTNINFSTQATTILKNPQNMQKTEWFIDATLNFAENLLWKNDNQIALISCDEHGNEKTISYLALRTQVFSLANHLKKLGLKEGDRVAALATNTIETVIAMLASTLIGCIWSACGPEFGLEALTERFAQITPALLFAISEHTYNGKRFTHTDTITHLKNNIPSIKNILMLDEMDFSNQNQNNQPLSFPFNHPLYILYSSGTTGKPKCIVHGAGNTLIQHKKELMLHTDLHENDTLFFYTTCSWMMWPWMISGLSVGATLVLYDGAPTAKPTILLDIVDRYNVSIFGCGAKIIETYLKNNLHPKETHHLTNLKTILTTGSPLLKESFDYIYRDIKNSVRVSSISGGTDIISCFALGNPLLPVYAEEIQCRGLGMAVDIFDDKGKPVKNQASELVCTNPFPSMPRFFWNDASGEKYFQAYFAQYKNVWTHGDFAKLTEHDGIIIYGRSDATLNPSGVRIGTADIYTQVLKLPCILDCVAVAKQENGDESIILFVQLTANEKLTETMISTLKKQIRDNTTPYHVPKHIYQVSAIPKTMNGKTMEMVVKNIVNHRPVKNIEALANPSCLKEFEV